GGFYTIDQDKDGNTTLTKTDQKGKMTKAQKTLHKSLSGIIDNEKNVNIELVSNGNNVLIGNYDQSKIDMGDVANFGSGEAINSLSVLMHEVVEQGAKQINGMSYEQAHAKGIQIEKDLTGYARQESAATSTLMRDPSKIGGSGTVEMPYTRGKSTVHVLLQKLSQML